MLTPAFGIIYWNTPSMAIRSKKDAFLGGMCFTGVRVPLTSVTFGVHSFVPAEGAVITIRKDSYIVSGNASAKNKEV